MEKTAGRKLLSRNSPSPTPVGEMIARLPRPHPSRLPDRQFQLSHPVLQFRDFLLDLTLVRAILFGGQAHFRVGDQCGSLSVGRGLQLDAPAFAGVLEGSVPNGA